MSDNAIIDDLLRSQEVLGKIAERLKILGEKNRLNLLMHLMEKGELNVAQLVDLSGQLQANVSKHLGLLIREGFVSRRKEGLNVFYKIDDSSIKDICKAVCSRMKEQDDENHKVFENR